MYKTVKPVKLAIPEVCQLQYLIEPPRIYAVIYNWESLAAGNTARTCTSKCYVILQSCKSVRLFIFQYMKLIDIRMCSSFLITCNVDITFFNSEVFSSSSYEKDIDFEDTVFKTVQIPSISMQHAAIIGITAVTCKADFRSLTLRLPD